MLWACWRWHIDRFLTEVSQIEQASTQWTLAQLYEELDDWLSPAQRATAIDQLKANLLHWHDWIVINNTLQALGNWARTDADLREWLRPHIQRFREEDRRSIANRATKLSKALYGR